MHGLLGLTQATSQVSVKMLKHNGVNRCEPTHSTIGEQLGIANILSTMALELYRYGIIACELVVASAQSSHQQVVDIGMIRIACCGSDTMCGLSIERAIDLLHAAATVLCLTGRKTLQFFLNAIPVWFLQTELMTIGICMQCLGILSERVCLSRKYNSCSFGCLCIGCIQILQQYTP